jgi:hypothetical protein
MLNFAAEWLCLEIFCSKISSKSKGRLVGHVKLEHSDETESVFNFLFDGNEIIAERRAKYCVIVCTVTCICD